MTTWLCAGSRWWIAASLVTGTAGASVGAHPTVPNDAALWWSADARFVAFQREVPAGTAARLEVLAAPVGHGSEITLGGGVPRGRRLGGDELLIQRGGGPDGTRIAFSSVADPLTSRIVVGTRRIP